jgi:hypothetical protein
LQALAGLGATLSGAAVAVFDPEPITKVGGAAFAAISADYYVTGMNTMIFGKPAMTATATALSGVAQDAGMDPQTADNLARGTNDAIVGLGGLKASMVASEAMAARLAAVAPKGSLTIDSAGTYSASEKAAAQHMADLGNEVTLRPPTGTRAGGGTSDLLVNGTRYDVYTPTTGNPDRIISAIAKKNSQAEGIVLDLSQTSVTQAQLGDILRRVQGAGATNIKNIVIIGGG